MHTNPTHIKDLGSSMRSFSQLIQSRAVCSEGYALGLRILMDHKDAGGQTWAHLLV